MMARKVMAGASGVGVTSPNDPFLAAYYTGDSFSGSTILDETANGNDLPAVGTPTTAAGVIGNAVNFDATADYYKASTTMDSSLYNATEGAISVWIKKNAASNFCMPFFFSDDAGLNILYAYYDWGANRFFIQAFSSGSLVMDFRDDITLNTTSFHHMVAQNNAGTMELWVNGAQIGGPWSLAPVPVSKWLGDLTGRASMKIWLGNATQSGLVDLARTRTKHYSASEIAELYNGGAGA